MKKGVLWTLSLLLTFAVSAYSFAGTNISGGGFIVRENGSAQTVLLDFYEQQNRSDFHPYPVTLGRVAEVLGYERKELSELPAYGIVEFRLGLWEKSSPVTVRLIRQALDNVSWRFTHYDVPLPAEGFVQPENLPVNALVEPAIIYSELLGALVSAPRWNQLGGMSQAGLIIHESLRHAQISYGIELSTAKLQKVTAALLLSSPSEGVTLDSEAFLDGEILDLAEQSTRLRKMKEELLAQAIPFLEKVAASREVPEKTRSEIEKQIAELQKLPSAKGSGEYSVYFSLHEMVNGLIGIFADSSPMDKELQSLRSAVYRTLSESNSLSISMNTYAYMDVNAAFSRILFGIGENALVDYAAGRSKESFWMKLKLADAADLVREAVARMGNK